MHGRLMTELARALQMPVVLQTWAVILLAAALLLAGFALARLSYRRREVEILRALALIAAHNRQAEQWLNMHQHRYSDWYEGRRRRHPDAVADAATLTLPRIQDPVASVDEPAPAEAAQNGGPSEVDGPVRTGPSAVEHYHIGGWVGPPGTCAAECACGVTFDGFDSLGEACQHLDWHIADATASEPVPVA